MKRVLVRYKIKPDRVEENERLVRAVYAELAEEEPEGLRYGTFKLEDGVSFVHIAESEADPSPLSKIAAFAAFQRGIEARTDEQPVVTELTKIGSYPL